jgi:hypothetical protein
VFADLCAEVRTSHVRLHQLQLRPADIVKNDRSATTLLIGITGRPATRSDFGSQAFRTLNAVTRDACKNDQPFGNQI